MTLLDFINRVNAEYLTATVKREEAVEAIRARAANSGAGYRDGGKWDYERRLTPCDITTNP